MLVRISLLLLMLLPGLAVADAARQFLSVSYHDVRDDVVADYDPDQYAVSTDNLAAHFRWLRDHGFEPVSLARIRAAANGGPALPEKAILLTFDDGYRSHYTRVYPLLKAFNYPAVFSLVTRWMEAPAGGEIEYGRETKTREDFLSWDEVREMRASGLAEFASHSHDLHRGVIANPQGNELPAAVARLYGDDGYESHEHYLERLRRDLARSLLVIQRETGHRPEVITWPYGKYSAPSIEVALELGMDINLTLDEGRGSLDSLARIPRYLIQANPAAVVLGRAVTRPEPLKVLRAAHVDLDYVYDEDPVQQEANLGRLLDRIRALQISHVFLQAFADPDADGAAEALYFPNRHLPTRADLFNRAAWQLMTRAEVSVYAWMPVLAFELPGAPPERFVHEQLLSGTRIDPDGEPRLSPFDPANRRVIRELYADLAAHARFDGLLFHDDARLNEFEDASPAGLLELRNLAGTDLADDALFRDPELAGRWARHKSKALTAFTLELAAVVQSRLPELKTARNLFADTALRPASELWLAQSLPDAMASYDHVALMAMPQLEGRDDAEGFLRALAARVIAAPRGPEQIIFELQTVDWRTDQSISATRLKAQMRMLQSLGIRHLAWYPDDFIGGQPDLELLRQGASLADYPHRRR